MGLRCSALAIGFAVLSACGLDLSGLQQSADAGSNALEAGASSDATLAGDAAAPSSQDAASDDGTDTSDAASEEHDDAGDPDAAAMDALPDDGAMDALPGDAAGAVTIAVPATDGDGCATWFDSGVTLATGQSIAITATGSWQYGPGPAYKCGPGGAQGGGTYDGFLYGELVGRVGGGSVFAIGATYSGAPGAGLLELGVNDAYCLDNSGTLQVTISP